MLHHKKIILVIILTSFVLVGFQKTSIRSLNKVLRRFYSAANTKATVTYNGSVPATSPGKTAVGISMQSTGVETQIILFFGRVTVKGKIIPQTAGTPLPTKLRLTMKHNNSGGKTLSSTNFDVNVQSDGTILTQSVAYTNFQVFDNKDVLQLLASPVDKSLPAGKLNLTAAYAIGASAANLEPDPMTSSNEADAVPQFIYQYVGPAEGGKALGPLVFKVIGQSGFKMNGTLRINGKIIPDEAGDKKPVTLQATIAHKNQTNNSVISNQNLTVKVQPNGQVLIQSFPFTTTNTLGLPESLQVTLKPNIEFPYSTVNVRFTYTPAAP
ncbi:MAG TPA: hypothetical protein VH815_09125 [Acidobacteriota bacterium]|jgi:hypothetical protein